jgi:hypothetical protein
VVVVVVRAVLRTLLALVVALGRSLLQLLGLLLVALRTIGLVLVEFSVVLTALAVPVRIRGLTLHLMLRLL